MTSEDAVTTSSTLSSHEWRPSSTLQSSLTGSSLFPEPQAAASPAPPPARTPAVFDDLHLDDTVDDGLGVAEAFQVLQERPRPNPRTDVRAAPAPTMGPPPATPVTGPPTARQLRRADARQLPPGAVPRGVVGRVRRRGPEVPAWQPGPPAAPGRPAGVPGPGRRIVPGNAQQVARAVQLLMVLFFFLLFFLSNR